MSPIIAPNIIYNVCTLQIYENQSDCLQIFYTFAGAKSGLWVTGSHKDELMKHLFALFGAVIGAGMAALISPSWYSFTIGICMGIFFGYLVAGFATAKGTILHEDFVKLGDLRGRTLKEIVAAVGPFQERENCVITDMDNAPGFKCTWAERNYLITLLFDQNSICLGITHEITK